MQIMLIVFSFAAVLMLCPCWALEYGKTFSIISSVSVRNAFRVRHAQVICVSKVLLSMCSILQLLLWSNATHIVKSYLIVMDAKLRCCWTRYMPAFLNSDGNYAKPPFYFCLLEKSCKLSVCFSSRTVVNQLLEIRIGLESPSVL